MKLRIAGLAKSKRGREKKDFMTEVGRFSKSYVRGLLEEIKDLEDKSVDQPTPGDKRKRVESSKRLFVMGFTIVAKNIMEGGSSFSPNDAFDCATARCGDVSPAPPFYSSTATNTIFQL